MVETKYIKKPPLKWTLRLIDCDVFVLSAAMRALNGSASDASAANAK
jgi:hypothetical protein